MQQQAHQQPHPPQPLQQTLQATPLILLTMHQVMQRQLLLLQPQQHLLQATLLIMQILLVTINLIVSV